VCTSAKRDSGDTEEALPLKSRLEMAPQTPPPAFQPPPLVPVPPPGVSLAEELDKTLMLQLRDRRILVGTMRSFDQFANIVLEGACERIIVGKCYSEKPLGLQIIRGENIVLFGELKEDDYVIKALERVSLEEIERARKAEQEAERMKGGMLSRFDFLDGLE
jgi:U6 snRNA-associated Sm-like protein LSm1